MNLRQYQEIVGPVEDGVRELSPLGKRLKASTLRSREAACQHYIASMRWCSCLPHHLFGQRIHSSGAAIGPRIKIVYFIQMLCTKGFVKIGSTKSLWSRISSMRVSNPYRFRVLGLKFGNTDDEVRCQGELLDTNESGEWFLPSTELYQMIRRECDIHFLDYGVATIYKIGSSDLGIPKQCWVVPAPEEDLNFIQLANFYKRCTWEDNTNEFTEGQNVITSVGQRLVRRVIHKDGVGKWSIRHNKDEEKSYDVCWNPKQNIWIRGEGNYLYLRE